MKTIIVKKNPVLVPDFENVKLTKDVLHLEIELQKPELSASGKTLVVASSHGYEKINLQYKGKPFAGMLNAYIGVNGHTPYEKTGETCAKIEGKKLIIELKMQKPVPSSTGKTNLVCNTGGFITTDAKVEGKNVRISFIACQK